jgi:short-subunit dehydrogenase
MSKLIVLVTGAAAGIGRHAALDLAVEGHRVIATGRSETSLAALRRDAASLGVELETLRLDVVDAAAIEQAHVLVDRMTDGHGVDVLINNAGYGLGAPLAEATDADLRAQFDTNVFGLMAVTRAFLPKMIARRSGRVLNVSSIGGRVTFPMMGAYHASKYALEALSDALRMELAPFGVKVVLVEPGPINTGFVDRLNQTADAYRHERSLYHPVFERADVIERRAMEMAPGPAVISRVIRRAIAARRPAARYIAPFSSRLLLAFVQALPTRLRDAIFRAAFGLSAKRLSARAADVADAPVLPPPSPKHAAHAVVH